MVAKTKSTSGKLNGNLIRGFRRQRGFKSQEKLGIAAGVSRHTVMLLEGGSQNHTFPILCDVANALGVNVKDFITD